MKGISFDLEDIRDEVQQICEDEYTGCRERDSYIVEGTTASSVRQNILSKLENRDMAKLKYLDMVAYVLDVDGKTIINLA